MHRNGESGLRSFVEGFMIPESAGKGTVLEGGEEFIERGEMGYVYRTLLRHTA
jgi:hypothetical protein